VTDPPPPVLGCRATDRGDEAVPEEDGVAEPEEGTDQGSGQRQRLFLHVGLPKSGSTYLQSVLGSHRGLLREHGHVYPFVRQEGMFHAAVEMAGNPARWGLDPEQIRGTFAHLLRRGRRLGGDVVISHEIFGAATREQVTAMGELLDDFEVHLVVTARDLGRTATAEWQEQVKNGHPQRFDVHVEELLAELPDDPAEAGDFWKAQNLLGLLQRWQVLVPPERMHVVTAPRSGAPPDLLWRRFAEAIDLPPDAVDLDAVPIRNESLGRPQVALLRRVLFAVDDRLPQPWHSRVVKRWFAQTLLSTVRSPKPVTPTAVVDRLAVLSRSWVDAIARGGYQVHGDLDELVPSPALTEDPAPDDATKGEMFEGLPKVLAEMLVRVKDQGVEIEELTSRQAELTTERDALGRRADELAARVAELEGQLAEVTTGWVGWLRPWVRTRRAVRAAGR
jgi:hypothetical protein